LKTYCLKKKFLFIFFIVLFFFYSTPLIAMKLRDFKEINMLVKDCYQKISMCNEALFKINNYQKNAAKNQKFSCQTRLLGLEANLIMAMDSNFKRKDASILIEEVRKYC